MGFYHSNHVLVTMSKSAPLCCTTVSPYLTTNNDNHLLIHILVSEQETAIAALTDVLIAGTLLRLHFVTFVTTSCLEHGQQQKLKTKFVQKNELTPLLKYGQLQKST